MKNKLIIAFIIGPALVFSQDNASKKLGTYLTKMWELDPATKRGSFKPSSYKPIYLLPFRWTNNPNRKPTSFNSERPSTDFKNFDNVEFNFQISLKSKIIQDAFFGKGDFWVGYTQTAFWQVYNNKISRPFRELNYEPEIIFSMPLNMSIKNFRWKMVNIALNHQSNGKEQETSRSWNRIILTNTFEWRNFVLTTQNWVRFSEEKWQDDNPQIEDYTGRMSIEVAYKSNKHLFWVRHRNNLSFKHNRGSTEFSYVHPISGDLKIMFQVTHGYGDSLIDYNHKQTSVGVGVVFFEF